MAHEQFENADLAATFMTVDDVQQGDSMPERAGRRCRRSDARLAVCPSLGLSQLSMTSTPARRKGERRYIISALVGDVILVQPDAFAQVAFKVA